MQPRRIPVMRCGNLFMIWLTTRAWPWLKKNWKWVLFPVGVLLALNTVLFARAILEAYAEPPRDLDEKTRKALKELRNAELVRDQKIAELEVRNVERLRELSAEQRVELEELQDKSLEEVAAWFDHL